MKVIVIEGIDGSGKSTIASVVADKMREEFGMNAFYLHFPNDTTKEDTIGNRIYDYLNGKMPTKFTDLNYKAQWMLFAMDRYEWFLKNWSKYENAILICDRYTTSSILYQGANMYMQALELMDSTPYVHLLDSKFRSKFDLKVALNDSAYYTYTNTSSELEDDDYDTLIKLFDNFANVGTFIKRVINTEFNIFGIPTPEKVFYIRRDENADRFAGKDKDAFEDNNTVQHLADVIASTMCSNECIKYKMNPWKMVYNDDLNNAINMIIESIKKIPFTMNYTLQYNKDKI